MYNKKRDQLEVNEEAKLSAVAENLFSDILRKTWYNAYTAHVKFHNEC